MSSELHQTVTTAESAYQLKGTIAPVLMAIIGAFTLQTTTEEKKPANFWQKRITETATNPTLEAVRKDDVVRKTLELTALLDIASPNTPSLATHLKLKQPKLKAIDEKQLLLEGAPITCVSSIHGIIRDAADALLNFSKEQSTHSLTVRMNAALVSQQLTSFTTNTDNTVALMEMESLAASAQKSLQQQRAA